jgi:hypothetical protein
MVVSGSLICLFEEVDHFSVEFLLSKLSLRCFVFAMQVLTSHLPEIEPLIENFNYEVGAPSGAIALRCSKSNIFVELVLLGDPVFGKSAL